MISSSAPRRCSSSPRAPHQAPSRQRPWIPAAVMGPSPSLEAAISRRLPSPRRTHRRRRGRRGTFSPHLGQCSNHLQTQRRAPPRPSTAAGRTEVRTGLQPRANLPRQRNRSRSARRRSGDRPWNAQRARPLALPYTAWHRRHRRASPPRQRTHRPSSRGLSSDPWRSTHSHVVPRQRRALTVARTLKLSRVRERPSQTCSTIPRSSGAFERCAQGAKRWQTTTR